MHLLLLLVVWTTSAAAATVAQSPLPLTIATPDVPAGGVAQLRIALAQPRQIASGRIVMDFDPAVFGPVSAIDVFSANGDQIGVANLRDRHLDAQFSSPSGGIGRLPSMPAITVTVPVLATAKAGTAGSISLSAGEPWKDVQGYQYVLAPQTVHMKVGGSLSIDSVTPGGGLLTAGSVVRIAGHGFAASTVVEIGSLVVSSTAFISPAEIDMTLGAPADLTGKRVVVKNPDGAQADIYCALRGRFHTPTAGTQQQPIFPLQTYYGADEWPDAQNPNTEPIDLTYEVVTTRGLNTLPQAQTVKLDPGEIATIPPTIIGLGSQRSWELHASKPVRMLAFAAPANISAQAPVPVFAYFITPGLSLGWNGGNPTCSVDPFLGLPAHPLCLVWLAGAPPPNPPVLLVGTAALATDFTVTIGTADGGDWLFASPLRGSTCVASSSCQPTKLTLSLNPTSLAPGEYVGTITIDPQNPVYSPETVTLLLHVANSLISVQGPVFLSFTTDADSTVPDPIELQVISSGDSLPFTASIRNPPTVFGNWFSVSPASGTTPATVTVTADPSALPSKYPGGLNYITISGPANSVTRTVMLSRRQNPVLYTSTPGPLTFWIKAGATTSATRLLTVSPYVPDTATVITDSGGNWLSASIAGGLSVSVDPSGLDVGTYHGTITAATTAHREYAPAQVVVNLIVWAGSPPVSVSPASIVASVPSGSSSSSYPDDEDALPLIDVASEDTPVESSVAVTTDDGNDWLIAPSSPIPFRYGSVFLAVDARKLPPGTYHGTVTLTAPPESSNSLVVPVTLNVTPARPAVLRDAPPLAVSLVNGASQTIGPVTPGELVCVYGLNIGPEGRVLFDDLPATLVTASQIRVDAIVPREIQGRASVTVAVEHSSARTILGGIPIVAAAPAVFTADGSGVGQASAIDEGDSANSAANPAARGSLIRIHATGAGTALPLDVKIQGTDATVASSIETNGVLELQVRVPSGIQPGAAVPVIFTAGSARSQDGVTISVK